MTPAELHAALDARRVEEGKARWELAVELDCSLSTLRIMRHGHLGPGSRERAEEWLRRPVPPQKE